DQILVTARALSEVFVIDHSTTTEEAAGHTGGNSGMGGDLLYRWGNPEVYHRGGPGDRYFYSVHGGVWIDCGLPGEGGILTFNNGARRPGVDFSSVEEIQPPRDANGNYHIDPTEPFGPAVPTWVYEPGPTFFSQNKSGAYRLPNGNTLITEANAKNIFEVTVAGEKVWSYNPPDEVHRAQRYWSTPTPPIAYLDIKPRSRPNPLNIKWLENLDNGNDKPKPRKGGVLPAAIVGTGCFDVTDVDVSTLRLEGIAPLRSSYEDVTQPAGNAECECTGDGPDGFTDLTLKFSRQEVAGVLGSVEDGDVIELTITGSLMDGTSFEASDCVTILAKKTEPEPRLAAVLYPAVPNPFNPETTIRYDVTVRGHLSLSVYDVAGRLVRTLVDEVKAPMAGGYSVTWNGRNNNGEPVPSGVYFYRLATKNATQTRKMVMLK
ncbi:MAG: T9SS type A sorting domain-containing protein, partial [Candidatus Krumholzibacteria bacterium]|nr:T9SS type A sorting domain-containing protein [Candidatus Krumholzibacteria bacterium]